MPVLDVGTAALGRVLALSVLRLTCRPVVTRKQDEREADLVAVPR